MIACSEMGVARTRRVPNFVERPLVTLKTPPIGSATSSPRMITLSSAVIAHSSAEFIAAADFIGVVTLRFSTTVMKHLLRRNRLRRRRYSKHLGRAAGGPERS